MCFYIAFVSARTQSMIERNAGTKQLHHKRLIQASKGHHSFWEWGRARFPALSPSPHSTYSQCSLYQAFAVASEWFRHPPAVIAILESHFPFCVFFKMRGTTSDLLVHYCPRSTTEFDMCGLTRADPLNEYASKQTTRMMILPVRYVTSGSGSKPFQEPWL